MGDTTKKGRDWLWTRAKQLYSESDTGVVILDNFAQLLIYEALGDLDLLNLKVFDRTWNYFIGSPWGTTETYPDDVDTTCYALKLLRYDDAIVHSVMDEMASPQLTTADGIVQVYFDDSRNRVDPTVCINVVRLYFWYDRGSQPELQPTKDWIHSVLLHREYLNGTRYYHSSETFLYFFARLVQENPNSTISRVTPILRERLMERINCEGDALGIAMRVLACHIMGIPNDCDLQRLVAMQQKDGSFGIGWLCRFGKTKIKVGNRALTTAMAVRAIEAAQNKGVDKASHLRRRFETPELNT